VAILLFAVGLLLTLCLVSAAFIRAILLEFGGADRHAELGRRHWRERRRAAISIDGIAAYLLPFCYWQPHGGVFARAASARHLPFAGVVASAPLAAALLSISVFVTL